MTQHDTPQAGPDAARPDDDAQGQDVVAAIGGGRGRLVTVIALFAVALLAVGFLVGYAVNRAPAQADDGTTTAATAVPADGSVDVGFLRDMITHHDQAVVMAHYGELDSQDVDVQRMAYDINATQQGQIGTMKGWLMLWDKPEQVYGPRMAWMGSQGGHDMAGMSAATTAASAQDADGALMPGMATDAEMAKLKTLRGTASDVFFLQLMLRHHEGGATMMQYAADHASNPIVANFAYKMVVAQSGEISVMKQMLAQRGAQPLPFP